MVPGRDVSWKAFLLALKDEWRRDNVGDVAGALTFFAILAIFPFLLFLVALASVVIDPLSAERLVEQLGEVAPAQVTQLLGGFILRLGAQQQTGLLTVGALGAVWAASGGIVSLMRALNTAYGVRETRPFWKVRLIAIAMTVMTAAFAVAAALVAVAVPPLAAKFGGPVAEVVRWVRLPIAAFLMTAVWALLYSVLPNRRLRFRLLTPGSVVGVVIWLVASWGFSVYVANFGKYEATYGALGGVVVLLFWMWISSQVVLLGAEINALVEQSPMPTEKPPGEIVPAPMQSRVVVVRPQPARWPMAAGLASVAVGLVYLARARALRR